MKFITISPQAILTRYWTSGWTTTGNPAPAVAFFQSGAYRGWLGNIGKCPFQMELEVIMRDIFITIPYLYRFLQK